VASAAEQHIQITPPVHHPGDLYARLHDAVKNEIFSDRKAAIPLPKLVAGAAGARILSEQLETSHQRIDGVIGGCFLVLGNIAPNIQQIPGARLVRR
jgi:hypothetical protein